MYDKEQVIDHLLLRVCKLEDKIAKLEEQLEKKQDSTIDNEWEPFCYYCDDFGCPKCDFYDDSEIDYEEEEKEHTEWLS